MASFKAIPMRPSGSAPPMRPVSARRDVPSPAMQGTRPQSLSGFMPPRAFVGLPSSVPVPPAVAPPPTGGQVMRPASARVDFPITYRPSSGRASSNAGYVQPDRYVPPVPVNMAHFDESEAVRHPLHPAYQPHQQHLQETASQRSSTSDLHLYGSGDRPGSAEDTDSLLALGDDGVPDELIRSVLHEIQQRDARLQTLSQSATSTPRPLSASISARSIQQATPRPTVAPAAAKSRSR